MENYSSAKNEIVLWRVAHDCTGQLKNRNIPTQDLSCHCGKEESVNHAFLECPYVVEI